MIGPPDRLLLPFVNANGKWLMLGCSPFIFSNWRRGWDSNPRNGFPLTAFPVLPIQPLLHLSGGISDCGFRISDLEITAQPDFKSRRFQIRNSQSEIRNLMAERVGFEPTVEFPPIRFSRPVH